MKLATNIHSVSRHCWKGQRSEVNVIPNAIMVETCILMPWYQGSLVH